MHNPKTKLPRDPLATEADIGEIIAEIEITQVVRDSIMVGSRGGTQTIGQMIDSLISDAATDRRELQDLHITFTPEQWRAIAG